MSRARKLPSLIICTRHERVEVARTLRLSHLHMIPFGSYLIFGGIVGFLQKSPIINVTGGEECHPPHGSLISLLYVRYVYPTTEIDYRFTSHVNVIAFKKPAFVIRTLLSFLAFGDAFRRKSVKLYTAP